MKSIRNFLIGMVIGVSLVASTHLLYAQTAAVGNFNSNVSLVQAAAPDSIVQIMADAEGLSLVSPGQAPRTGTFWWILPSGTAVPAPCPPQNDLTTPIYQLAAGQFLVDQTGGQIPAIPRRFGMQAQTAGGTAVSGLELEADTVLSLILRIQTYAVSQQMGMMSRSMGMDVPGFNDTGNGGSGTNDLLFSIDYASLTNGLWLEITNVSNGYAWLNLHNATNQVYEIFSKTDLSDASWNIEQELWPTDTNSMPFTIPVMDRTNALFVWARDWTGITSNGNETPEWWFWKFFGTVDLADSYLDSSGRHTLWGDYNSGADPNVISFTMWAAGRHVNHPWVPLQISVSGGIPAYMAALANDTNFADASWQPYTGSNVVVTLGNADGVYGVQLGLRGLPADAQQTWNGGISFTLDRVAPVLTITNPVAGVVSAPTVQVRGFVNEQLSSLTFDVSNTAGIFTNQTGFVTGEFYDTNLQEFTTNYFQCYDVPLTNGLNSITLHATDLAGNTTTTNVSITSDYSGDTTAPLLTVVWPQDGTAISGSQFTFQGAVDKPGATITATIADANGDTNMVQGLVEQSGIVWAQNLPLASGANTLTLTAANAAGTNTVQLTLCQSDVTVTMNPLSGGQFNQPYVNVTGTVSDPSCSVFVNGVEAYLVDDAGGWEADTVPVCPSGTALFDVEVYPGGSSSTVVRAGLRSFVHPAAAGNGSSIGSEQFALTQPVMVGMMSYRNHDGFNDKFPNQPALDPAGQAAYANSDEQVNWNYRSGGENVGYYFYTGSLIPWSDPADEQWDESLPAGQDNFNAPWEMASAASGGQAGYYVYLLDFARWNDTETRVMLEPPGGQAAGITNYYLVQAQAWGFSDPLEVWNNWPLSPDTLKIGGVALTLVTNGDGSVWGQRLIAARAGENVEVTPIAPITDYSFNVQATQPLSIESRDRLVHGVIRSVRSDDIVNVTIANRPNSDTTQNFGTYYDVFGNNPEGMATHQTYASEDDILADDEVDEIENGAYAFGDQKVIFVKDANDPQVLHFYTVADNYGQLTVTLDASASKMPYQTSQTQPLTQSGFGEFSFGDVITYLDARINSPELVSVPTTPFNATPPPIQQRSLLTKTLIGIFKGGLNPQVSLVHGTVEGFMGGAHSDYDGIVGVWNLLSSSAQRAAAFKALTTWNTYAQIPNSIETGAANFMTTAESTAVTFQFGQTDFSDDVSVRFYVGGYAAGFTTEQICVCAVGAGIASKAGTAAKLVVASTSTGTRILDGVATTAKAAQRFKSLSVDFAVNTAQKAARTTGLPQAAEAMADAVSKIPAGSSTVGEIIANSVQRIDVLCDEILISGHPLEDFGVYAEDQLGSLDQGLVSEIGASGNEAALRGHVELKDAIGDSYETDFIDAHRDANGVLNNDAVVTDLETFNDSSSIPAWKQRILDGKAFDETRKTAYDFNQVYVLKPSGKGYFRLDSYKLGMIVSRKYTQFASIAEATGKKYVDELAAKYPSGATIASVPSNIGQGLSGGTLSGNLYLEVPVQTSAIPQSILDEAAAKNVTIIDINGTTY